MAELITNKFTVPFVKKERVAKNTWEFFFDKTVLTDYSFFPGQYTNVILPIFAKDGKGNIRSFTIASSPLDKKYVAIITKIEEPISDFKKSLCMLKKNELVTFSKPIGGFYLRETEKQEKVFLSAGVGITPFLSSFVYMQEKKLQIPVTLIASFSTPESIIPIENFLSSPLRQTNQKIIYTITQPEIKKTIWHGEVGRISKDLLKKYIPNMQDKIFMIAGTDAFVDAMETMLSTLKIPEENIKVDIFLEN